MSLREVLSVIRFRWYVAVAVLLVTAAAGAWVHHPKPTFVGTCVVVLEPPADPTAPNRLSAVTSSIATAGYMVNLAVMDDSQADALRRAGVVGEYAITPNNNGTAETPQYDLPSEVLTVETGDPKTAVSGVAALEAAYAKRFQDIQAQDGVPKSLWITPEILVPPVAQQVIGSRSRGVIGVGALGLAAMVILPIWYDRWATRRRGRGRGRGGRMFSAARRRATARKAA
ncbi:MAG TPA: hypothetical protein VFU73_06220 [Actinocrinis sp.]|nr:hypothetical protein [Actinocrinis sp.]